MSGLSRECRTCCRKSRIKFSRQTKKQARIFQARKYEVHIFQQEASLFPSWPAGGPEPNASRPPAHSLPAPAGQHLTPPFFPYRLPQSYISQLSYSRLGRPKPYITSNHFFNTHKASSSHQVSLPTILPKSTNNHLSQASSRRISVIFPDITPHHSTHLLFSIFPFSILRPTSSRPSSFRTSNSNLIPPLSLRPPLPSCCRFSNPQAKRET